MPSANRPPCVIGQLRPPCVIGQLRSPCVTGQWRRCDITAIILCCKSGALKARWWEMCQPERGPLHSTVWVVMRQTDTLTWSDSTLCENKLTASVFMDGIEESCVTDDRVSDSNCLNKAELNSGYKPLILHFLQNYLGLRHSLNCLKFQWLSM